jgi:hypothetical protein
MRLADSALEPEWATRLAANRESGGRCPFSVCFQCFLRMAGEELVLTLLS